MRDTDNESKKLKKRLKILFLICSSVLLITLIVLLVVLISLLTDKNRSSYVRRNIEATEIVKKNYIDGFKNAENTGNFSYILPKDDINELLCEGVDAIDDKHIESVYYDFDEDGKQYFYVDLSKVVIKTRVVITTIPYLKDNTTVGFAISECTIGKANALKYLQRKGYLTSEWIDSLFAKSHLPITYEESTYSFLISPYKWIDMFPESTIGDQLFKNGQETSGSMSLNANLFGFDLDLSKLKTSTAEFIDVNTTDTPNLNKEIKQACINNYSSISVGDTSTVYSLNEEGLNKLLASSFTSTMTQELISNYTENTLVFDLKGANAYLEEYNKITIKLFFSINGYLLDKNVKLSYNVNPSNVFNAYFYVDGLLTMDLSSSVNNVFACLAESYQYFAYQGSNKMLTINFESMNNELADPNLKYCEKLIELNHASKVIEFKITKA